jgi:hypothetical protein
MANEINAMLAADGLKEMAPKDMFEFNSFAGIVREKIFTWVPVQVISGESFGPERKKLVLL